MSIYDVHASITLSLTRYWRLSLLHACPCVSMRRIYTSCPVQGSMEWSTKNTYNGMWKGDKRHGKGTYVWSTSQDVYEGSWKNDKRNGPGLYTWNAPWSAGLTYQGGWKNSMKHGLGLFIWTNGNAYDGSWKEDMRTGAGVLVWKNGDKYDGMVSAGACGIIEEWQ